MAALDQYYGRIPRAHLPEASAQMKQTEAAIMKADGALGPLVDRLRREPDLSARV